MPLKAVLIFGKSPPTTKQFKALRSNKNDVEKAGLYPAFLFTEHAQLISLY